ncbi:MAG: hypothetical protein ACRYF4_00005, partial [Janthinobacterium lividum]
MKTSTYKHLFLTAIRTGGHLRTVFLLGTTLAALPTLAVPAQGTIPVADVVRMDRAVTIQVDLARPLGEYKPVYSWFGYDEGNYTTGRDGKVLLRELHDLSPVPVYIRAHHLLTSGDGVPELKWSSTNVYTEDSNGKPVYDFTILDGIFDEYKAAGV